MLKHLISRSNNFFLKISKKNFPRYSPTIQKKLTESPKLNEKTELSLLNMNQPRVIHPSELMTESSEEESRWEEFDEHYLDYKFAHCGTTIMSMPLEFQNMARKVFSKHLAKDVREWSTKLLLRSTQNHACEPPINLENVSKKFANSNEIDVQVKIFNKKNEDPEKVVDIDNDVNKKQEPPKVKNEDTLNPIIFKYEKAHTVAYLYSRMPFTYGAMKKIVHDISMRMPNFKPNSVLDYGSGLGSCLLAAIEEFSSLNKIAAVEPNRNMRRLGKFLLSYIEKELIWVDSITMIPGTGVDRGKFDLITVGHLLQELPNAQLRKMILETLWNRLLPDGILIVMEPGSPKGFRYINDLRNWVIEKDRDEACIVAPCTNHKKCPMAASPNDWCHFSQIVQKFPKDIFPKLKTESPIFNEKFSYIAIKKGKTPNSVYQNESETKIPEEKSFFWSRVIKKPMRKNTHVIVDMCTNEGELERRVISKSQGKDGGYKNSKKCKWGDLWYVDKYVPNKFRKEFKKGKRLW